jgi:gamma-glutamylcyclotransferase (GGCT)/AIG2-like uncharacterized protein YtfP
MSEYLFVYGTLQPGRAPRAIAGAVGMLQPVGAGSARGRLYDLGRYPGAVLDRLAEQRIHGMVFRLPEDAGILARFDRYEGYSAEAQAESLFLRVLEPVELASGGSLDCWVYVYNRPPAGARVLADGRYPEQRDGA